MRILLLLLLLPSLALGQPAFSRRGPAGPAGAQGPAGADGDPGADGADAPGWATGAEPVIGDWASATGAATSVFKQAKTLGLLMNTALASDGVTDTDGDRVQGLVTAVPAGDFIVGLRVAFDRPGVSVDTTSTAIAALAVFIDGTDASTASWYGIGNYYSGVGFLAPTLYRFANTAGAARFETYSAFASIVAAGAHGPGPYDVFFIRSGTTLNAYLGAEGSVPQLVMSWTVSAGAGRVGLRIQTQLGVGQDMTGLIKAFKSFGATRPW